MPTLRSVVLIAFVSSLFGATLMSCARGRNTGRQDVRQDTRVEERTEDRMERRR